MKRLGLKYRKREKNLSGQLFSKKKSDKNKLTIIIVKNQKIIENCRFYSIINVSKASAIKSFWEIFGLKCTKFAGKLKARSSWAKNKKQDKKNPNLTIYKVKVGL